MIASRAGSPAGDVVGHALLTSGGLGAAVAVALSAGLLLYATVRAPGVQLGRLALTPLDMAALGAIGVVLVGWARGSVGAQQLTGGGGTNAFLLLVPALIVFAAAIVSARLLAPALRALGRAGRRGPVALRLAAASLARNPGHAAIAATFLVASLGLALFAVGYRSTLTQGQRDEAAFAVPGRATCSPRTSTSSSRCRTARSTCSRPSTPVVRLSGNVPSGTTFGFLALPRAGDRDGRRLAQRLRDAARAHSSPPRSRPAETPLKTVALPPGRQLTLPATGTGDDIGVRAFFRSALGDYVAVGLGHTRAGHTVAAARPRAVPARDARADPLRHPEQRPPLGERRHRHPAEREGNRLVRHAAHQRQAPCRSPDWIGTRRHQRTAREARLHPHARGRRADLPPGAGDRRPAAAGARDAARRRGRGPARRDPDRRRGRADRRADRRRRAAVPVDPGRRGRRRPRRRRRRGSTRARPGSGRPTSSGCPGSTPATRARARGRLARRHARAPASPIRSRAARC